MRWTLPPTMPRESTIAIRRRLSAKRSPLCSRHSRPSAPVFPARRARCTSGGVHSTWLSAASRAAPRRRTPAACRACRIVSHAKPIATKSPAQASGQAGVTAAEPFFYSYIYPEPDGYRTAPIAHGHFDESFAEYVLPYADMRAARRPAPDARRIFCVRLCGGRGSGGLGSRRARAEARRALGGDEGERRDRLSFVRSTASIRPAGGVAR